MATKPNPAPKALASLKSTVYAGVIAEGNARADVVAALVTAKDSDDMKAHIKACRVVSRMAKAWRVNALVGEGADIPALLVRAEGVIAKKPHDKAVWAAAQAAGPKALSALKAKMRDADEQAACGAAATYLVEIRRAAGFAKKPAGKSGTKDDKPEGAAVIEKPTPQEAQEAAIKTFVEPTPEMVPYITKDHVSEWAHARAALLRMDLKKNAKAIPLAARTLVQEFIKALEAATAPDTK